MIKETVDQIEAIAVTISAVNFFMLVLNYVAGPVRQLRAKAESLLVEIVRLQERLATIELRLGIRRPTEKT